MTEPCFFDNDCLSAFLWVNEQSILPKLYQGQIVIPKAVYDELSYPSPSIQVLRQRIDKMLQNNEAELRNIDASSEAYSLYDEMTSHPRSGHKIIGNGEAACLALAITENGIIASNNLKDITDYIEEFSLEHITTGDILVEAFHRNIITEIEGNNIWASMLTKKRKLGALTFSDYLEDH